MTTILFYQEHLLHEKEEGNRRHGWTGSSQPAPRALFFTIIIVVVIIPGRPRCKEPAGAFISPPPSVLRW